MAYYYLRLHMDCMGDKHQCLLACCECGLFVDECQLSWLVRNIHTNETWVKLLCTDGRYKVLALGTTGTTGDEKVLYLKCRIKLDANVGCINFE